MPGGCRAGWGVGGRLGKPSRSSPQVLVPGFPPGRGLPPPQEVGPLWPQSQWLSLLSWETGVPAAAPPSAAPNPRPSQTTAGPKPPGIALLHDVAAELSTPTSHLLFQILPGFLTHLELRISK